MANQSLTDITSVINQQIDTQESLSEHLCKLEAILCATSAERLVEYDEFILQNYLWALCDMTIKIKNLNEKALLSMLKGRSGFVGYL